MKLLLLTILASLNVISFNMRVGTANDGANSWEMRKAASAAMLAFEKPDIMGVQEALDYQIDYLKASSTDYEVIGVGREDGVNKGEHMSIFYKKSRIQCITWGTFWLSETPDKPSKGWDAACKRTATWALMSDMKFGGTFYVINTHLDHKGQTAREKGLTLILERLSQINKHDYPVIICGDFNSEEDNPALDAIKTKLNDTRKSALKTDSTPSFNAWGKSASTIDYIFQKGFMKCLKFSTLSKPYDRNIPFISDHWPVKATLLYTSDPRFNGFILK